VAPLQGPLSVLLLVAGRVPRQALPLGLLLAVSGEQSLVEL
jgi:hypothetical protein